MALERGRMMIQLVLPEGHNLCGSCPSCRLYLADWRVAGHAKLKARKEREKRERQERQP